MPVILAPSPNQNDRPAGAVIDSCVIHYTGMQTGEAALTRLRDPAAEVSAHYMIEEDGRIYQLVPEAKRAWHAGVSHWRGQDNINHTSIGIELVHPGHEWGYRPFEAPQIDALLELLTGLTARHRIPPQNFVGHSDIAPGRKADPGELFPWQRLAEAGFGLWVDVKALDARTEPAVHREDAGDHIAALQNQLVALGYGLDITGTYDDPSQNCVRALHAHWRPSHINRDADPVSRALIAALLQQQDQFERKDRE